MVTARTQTDDAPLVALWFGFLGGAVAWMADFLISYGLTEVGCNSELLAFQVLGFSGPEAVSLLTTAITGLVAFAATVVAYRHRPENASYNRTAFMTNVGVAMSGLFTFIILISALPVFFVPLC